MCITLCVQKQVQSQRQKALTNTNIYTEILAANLALDEAEVPETGRVILVTPATYVLMKQDTNITMETDIGNDLRLKVSLACWTVQPL